ncbi:MAG: hypothetical protein HOK84_12445 [Bacteroidetes bacterium]|jgi:hypothetical protein|nr:hypothetical protein [Bacteroidota bacterium]MBT5427000.1 hypothetical protein [Bacteroidota bacterium]MBT7466174.1 hypothetical protein [Bacteroidota bacterium]
MMKLLSNDYINITAECFKLPQKDFFDFYTNILEEHKQANPEILVGLQSGIDYWINWFHEVTSLPAWGIHENGEKYRIYPNKLLPQEYQNYQIRTHVDQDFFDRLSMELNNLIHGNLTTASLTIENFIELEQLAALRNELENSGYINSSYKWIGGSAKYAAILMKSLFNWGYAHTRLSNKDIHEVLINSFDTKISLSTIEHAKPEKDFQTFKKTAAPTS